MKTNLVTNQQSLFESAINELIESEKIQQAIDFINSQYEENPFLQDGFSRIGGICREKKDWIAAEQWMRRDFELGRMSADWQLRYAEALLVIDQETNACELVKKVYTGNPESTDGYARLGWAKGLKTEWKNAQPLMEKDDKAGRMSPQWRLHYALVKARCNDDIGATSEVEIAYSLDPTLIDGYSRLGGIKREKRDWNAAEKLIKRDRTLARISWEWQLRYAEVQLELGDEVAALKLVERTYSQYPEATDGHARLGWAKGRNNGTDWYECIDLMGRDYSAERISAAWLLHYAYSLIQTGNNKGAIDLVNLAYSKDPNLKDGFSRLGALKASFCDFNSAIDLISRDYKLGKLSLNGMLNYAQTLIVTGEIDFAEKIIKEAYAASKDNLNRKNLGYRDLINLSQVALRAGDCNTARSSVARAYQLNSQTMDGYTRLGWIKSQFREMSQACELMAKDHLIGRMSPEWYPDFAKVAAYCGETDKYGIGLRSQKEITAKWDASKPLISIVCVTYNHGEYIEDALRGFLIQETTYPFEIIIHDDASTDGTQTILKEYQSKYPDIINLILQQKNQKSQGIKAFQFYKHAIQGSYTAYCEGDDYWILPDKIEKQADLLERNPDYFVCSHAFISHNQSFGRKSKTKIYDGMIFLDKENLIKRNFKGKTLHIKVPTRMTRSFIYINSETYEQSQVTTGDIFSSSAFGLLGKGIYIGDYFGSVYRINNNSSWRPLDERKKYIEHVNTYYWLSKFYSRYGHKEMAKYWAEKARGKLEESLMLT